MTSLCLVAPVFSLQHQDPAPDPAQASPQEAHQAQPGGKGVVRPLYTGLASAAPGSIPGQPAILATESRVLVSSPGPVFFLTRIMTSLAPVLLYQNPSAMMLTGEHPRSSLLLIT